jgi:hypothetical protein
MVAPNKPRPLFDLGRTLATPGALAALEKAGVSPASLISRHVVGDWGCVCHDDMQANNEALKDGSRILSTYILPTKVKVWAITEAKDDRGRRAATTLLLPEEY